MVSTVPSRGAAMVCSIFIASMTISGWPCLTVSPAATRSWTTRPGIGADSRPACRSAPAGGASGSTRSSRQLSPADEHGQRVGMVEHDRAALRAIDGQNRLAIGGKPRRGLAAPLADLQVPAIPGHGRRHAQRLVAAAELQRLPRHRAVEPPAVAPCPRIGAHRLRRQAEQRRCRRALRPEPAAPAPATPPCAAR